MGKVIPNADEAFWLLVDKGGDCWTWTGNRTPDGYGHWRSHLAHRIALNSADPVPTTTRRICALHHCDNPPCVRPDHLYWGTDKDNARDRVNRNLRHYREHKAEASYLLEVLAQMTMKRAAAAEEYERVDSEWRAAVIAATRAELDPVVAQVAGVTRQRVSQIKQDASQLAT